MADLKAIQEALIYGKREELVELVKKALDEGIDASDLFRNTLSPAWGVVMEKFKNNEFYVPELLIAGRAMSNAKEADTKPGAMDILMPYMMTSGFEPIGTAVIGTVKGDLHDIGKNLVSMMLNGAGFNVVDLTIDVDAEKYVAAAKENNAQLVCLSALLTTTMPQMKTVIDALKEAAVACKVMIGGAPVTQSYADEVGADGYAPDAASAVAKAKELLAASA